MFTQWTYGIRARCALAIYFTVCSEYILAQCAQEKSLVQRASRKSGIGCVAKTYVVRVLRKSFHIIRTSLCQLSFTHNVEGSLHWMRCCNSCTVCAEKIFASTQGPPRKRLCVDHMYPRTMLSKRIATLSVLRRYLCKEFWKHLFMLCWESLVQITQRKNMHVMSRRTHFTKHT